MWCHHGSKVCGLWSQAADTSRASQREAPRGGSLASPRLPSGCHSVKQEQSLLLHRSLPPQPCHRDSGRVPSLGFGPGSSRYNSPPRIRRPAHQPLCAVEANTLRLHLHPLHRRHHCRSHRRRQTALPAHRTNNCTKVVSTRWVSKYY